MSATGRSVGFGTLCIMYPLLCGLVVRVWAVGMVLDTPLLDTVGCEEVAAALQIGSCIAP